MKLFSLMTLALVVVLWSCDESANFKGADATKKNNLDNGNGNIADDADRENPDHEWDDGSNAANNPHLNDMDQGDPALCKAKLAIVLVLDTSSSMNSRANMTNIFDVFKKPDGTGESKMDEAKFSAVTFVSKLADKDKAALVRISTNATVVSPLVDNMKTIQNSIVGLTPDGLTNITDALDLASKELHSVADAADLKKIIVLLSDGRQTVKTTGTPESKAQEIKKNSEIAIITIGFGLGNDTAAKNALKSIASSDNYFFDSVAGTNDLLKDFTTIASKMCR